MQILIFLGVLAFMLSGIASYPLPFPFPVPTGYDSSGNVVTVETDPNPVVTPLADIGDTVNDKIKQAVDSKAIQFVTPFPDSGRKVPVLESSAKESLPIQADIKYGNLQQFVANLLNPKPLVDTIQEHEKYGNDGGKGRAVGTAMVAAFEGLSNTLNALVDTPFQAAKTVGRKITNSLNQIGGKLVGLA